MSGRRGMWLDSLEGQLGSDTEEPCVSISSGIWMVLIGDEEPLEAPEQGKGVIILSNNEKTGLGVR